MLLRFYASALPRQLIPLLPMEERGSVAAPVESQGAVP
jgi:hypothetical protein